MSHQHDPSHSHPAHWALVARTCAERAYAARGSTKRGVMLVEDEDVLVYFDNTPVGGSMRARDRLVALLSGHLADRGVNVLASATHPQSGPDDGLSLAVVLDAGADEEGAVTEAWELTCREHLSKKRRRR